ncbi:MAG: biotin/lipoyl-binding protein [Anaerolineaceae bacterium]|nr:MAG: biotin/lipoyl-binding protein [Anaerolineaceae bacterium]
MKYVATIDDKTYEIEINNDREITLNGKPFSIDFLTIGGPPIISLLLEGRSYEAHVNSTDVGWEVFLRGQRYLVAVEDERQRQLREVSSAQALHRETFHLKAPMPGLIVAIPIEEGEQVKRGANLVVLESMKMQNELKAPRDGEVTAIRVKPGDNVDQEQVLVVLE